jgi:hypothetical protein
MADDAPRLMVTLGSHGGTVPAPPNARTIGVCGACVNEIAFPAGRRVLREWWTSVYGAVSDPPRTRNFFCRCSGAGCERCRR